MSSSERMGAFLPPSLSFFFLIGSGLVDGDGKKEKEKFEGWMGWVERGGEKRWSAAFVFRFEEGDEQRLTKADPPPHLHPLPAQEQQQEQKA